MSKLSEALEAMDKATPGPWWGDDEAPDFIWAKRDGEIFHVADARGWGTLQTDGQKGCDELSANIALLTAAPDALAWIKEALPYITEYRDALATNLENCDFGPREEGAARKELAHLDALIARAKPEV